jgi:hypothetical protein
MDMTPPKYPSLTLEEILLAPDQPSRIEMPPREDVRATVFEADGRKILSCKSDEVRLRIESSGDLRRVMPPADGGSRMSVKHIRKFADSIDTPREFRPDWLQRKSAIPKLLNTRDLNFPTIDPDRYIVLNEWPWTTIGKLFISPPGSTLPRTVFRPYATGVLVGPRHILTASHAMPWGRSDVAIRFAPGYAGDVNPAFGDAFIESWIGVKFEGSEAKGNDYVICKLDWRIGDRAGWMGSEWHEDDRWYFDHIWTSIGYPDITGGEYPSFRLPVRVREVVDEGWSQRIVTGPFATPGWSGGPLWGYPDRNLDMPRVIGIASGGNTEASVFGAGRLMVDLVKAGHANWP